MMIKKQKKKVGKKERKKEREKERDKSEVWEMRRMVTSRRCGQCCLPTSRHREPPPPPPPAPPVLRDCPNRLRGCRRDRRLGRHCARHHRRCLGCLGSRFWRTSPGPSRYSLPPAREKSFSVLLVLVLFFSFLLIISLPPLSLFFSYSKFNNFSDFSPNPFRPAPTSSTWPVLIINRLMLFNPSVHLMLEDVCYLTGSVAKRYDASCTGELNSDWIWIPIEFE